MEAIGYGIPVIAYGSGGLKEIVQNGTNGYLYDELDEASLLKSIGKLENLSEKDYEKMRKEARKSAEQYPIEVFEKKILTHTLSHR